MKINLVAIGKNMSAWVNQGYEEYAKRMPKNFALNLIEVPALTRQKNCNIDAVKIQECQRLTETVNGRGLKIVLDENGKRLTTKELSEKLQTWQETYREINFIVGGPDGLTKDFIDQADVVISLSDLTLPHPLVRVIVAEQLYRAYSILNNHPYHRE